MSCLVVRLMDRSGSSSTTESALDPPGIVSKNAAHGLFWLSCCCQFFRRRKTNVRLVFVEPPITLFSVQWTNGGSLGSDPVLADWTRTRHARRTAFQRGGPHRPHFLPPPVSPQFVSSKRGSKFRLPVGTICMILRSAWRAPPASSSYCPHQ